MNWAAIAQGAAQVAGQVAPAILQYRSAKKDREMQYDAAQNSISWRVQDAKNAGIHPLFALGAPTQNMNPTTVGYSPMDFASAFDMVANSKFNKELQSQTLEKNQLEIDGLKLRNQIAYLQSVKPMRDTMGQSPAPSASSQISVNPSSGNLASDIEPRYALNPVEFRPNVFKAGPSTNGWLQDAISEFGIATVPEQLRYLLNNETTFGMKEYRHLADIFNDIEHKRRSGNIWIAFEDPKYGPVLIQNRKDSKYDFDYYYGKNGRFKTPRDRAKDYYDRINHKYTHSDYSLDGLYGD